MVKLIDANKLIRFCEARKDHPYTFYSVGTMIEWINLQPHIFIDKVNNLEDIKKRGVFVAKEVKHDS